MPLAQEILDSEDEGSDFSPVKSAIGDGAHDTDDQVAIIDQLEARDEPRHVNVDETANVAKPDSGESTDLSFFQHVYDEQRHVTTSGDHSVTRTNPGSSDITEPQLRAKASSSLTSVTDPLPPTGPKTKKTYAARDVADLTQVTTPSRESANAEVESDPWGVPSSPPGAGSSANKALSNVARTYGKRKRDRAGEHQSSGIPPTQDPYDFPSTQEQGAKRARRRGMQSSRGEVSGSAGQMEEVLSTRRTPRRSGESLGLGDSGESLGLGDSGEIIPDTAPALGLGVYIAPSALTTSQKEEYQLVSLSSDAGEAGGPSLPSMGLGEVCKSSGTATVVFSTPSAYRSSARRVLPSDELSSVEEVDEGLEMEGGTHPASSPDVISEEPTRRKRGRPPMKKVLEELPPPLETRSAKKRRVVREGDGYDAPESPWNSNVGNSGRRGTRRGRVFGGLQDNTETESFIDLTTQPDAAGGDLDRDGDLAAAEEVEPEIVPVPKKKRGRKKKEVVQELDNFAKPEAEVTKVPAAIHEVAEVDEPEPPMKRRGRPRKSAAQPAVEQDILAQNTPAEPEPTSPDFVPDGLAGLEADKPTPAKIPGKRGRKKKQDTVKTTAPAANEEEPAPPPPVLSEISRNSQRSQEDEINASDDEDDDYDEDTKENPQPSPKKPKVAAIPPQVKKDVATVEKDEKTVEKKQTVTKKAAAASPAMAATTTKVQYRVGLSKKSRIAPLLKSLRK